MTQETKKENKKLYGEEGSVRVRRSFISVDKQMGQCGAGCEV